MTPLPHHYDVQLTGGPAGYAQLSAPGLPDLATAPPASFDGPGDAWSPEHLLLSAVATCFLFTLRAVAKVSKLELAAADVEAAGTVDRHEGVTRFTSITLRPQITVAAGIDHERVRHAVEKTERACLVSASLATPVRVDLHIVEARGVRGARPASQDTPVEALTR
jgi:peroxiredoxin-like protein